MAGLAASRAVSTFRRRNCSIRRPTRSCLLTRCERNSPPSGALDRPVIVYCGGGIAATADALALTMLGHTNVKVYDASMSEWAKDESLPMETG